MSETTPATETNASTIAPKEGTQVVIPAPDDSEAKLLALEAEKKKLEEEKDNYKNAYLKEKKKKSVEDFADETEEERIQRIVNDRISESRLMQIDREKEELLKKTLKENKELKLAQINRPTGTPASVGSHTEGRAVQDTLVTPEQLAFFKSKGWDDKTIERYKKNLLKSGSR